VCSREATVTIDPVVSVSLVEIVETGRGFERGEKLL